MTLPAPILIAMVYVALAAVTVAPLLLLYLLYRDIKEGKLW